MAFIGNKVTEKDLRDHLDSIGYFGRSARFLKLELAGIERPGWIQLFEFHVEAKKRDGDWEQLFGICRDDERSQTFEVQLLTNADQQKKSVQSHSETMITIDRPAVHWVQVLLLTLVVAALGIAIAGALSSENRDSEQSTFIRDSK